MDLDLATGFIIIFILIAAAYYIGYVHGQKSMSKEPTNV